MDLNLKGRVAVVTGGAAGIGEAIASALAAEGCKICIVDRNADAGRQAASIIATSGNQARSTVADVGDPAEVTRVFGEIATTEKRIDILVNAAGLLSTGLVADLSTDEWRRVSQVNLDGVLY